MSAPIISAARSEAQGGGHAIVVGASLGGLMAAIALSRRGFAVTMLERSDDSGRTGAALQGKPNLIGTLTGRPVEQLQAAGVQTWFSIHKALREAVDADRAIRIHEHILVDAVGQNEHQAWAIAANGVRYCGDFVVGADGHRSIVRRAVAPHKPEATFAGYVIWLGLCNENAIPSGWPDDTAFLEGGGYTLLGYPLPGPDNSHSPGTRQLGWAWYDASRNTLLRECGAVIGSVVQRSLHASDIPDPVFADLGADAGRYWPSPWREAVIDCVHRRAIIGTPIAEYVPDRLVNGRLCLVGDAAHVPTPMTGNGFSASLADAEALGSVLSAVPRGRPVCDALRDYEQERLATVRDLVQSGQNFSRNFARGSRR